MNDDIHKIEDLTHEDIRGRIAKHPVMVIPLGGCEPFGLAGGMGVENVCAFKVAHDAASRAGALVAPVIPFGCSAPFTAFPGSAGVKPRTYTNMLCEIIRAYIYQGIKKVFLVSAAPFNKEPALEAVRRLSKAYPEVTAAFYDINTLVENNIDCDRNDGALLSLYIYLYTNNFLTINGDIDEDHAYDGDKYNAWKRRGRDPGKFRKLCPDGLLLSGSAGVSGDRGAEIFDYLLDMLANDMGGSA